MFLFYVPFILAEASVSTEASDEAQISFTLVLSIFTTMFVGINLINSYIFKPISEEIERTRLRNAENGLIAKIPELNSDGQKKANDLIEELSQMPRKALFWVSCYDLFSVVIWFSVVGAFLVIGNIYKFIFEVVFGVFAFATIFTVYKLVKFLKRTNTIYEDVSSTIKIGMGNVPTPPKRQGQGKRKSV